MTFAEIIHRLKAGNRRFAAGTLNGEFQTSNRRNELAAGQSPYAIILGCADSRVVPELVFDAGLGELFTVRVAGNVANTSSIASIEYAVAFLKSKVIVVLGHESCGAVTAALSGGDNGKNLEHLLSHITSAEQFERNLSLETAVKLNAKYAAGVLASDSAILGEAVRNNDIRILPAYYHLASGEVEFL